MAQRPALLPQLHPRPTPRQAPLVLGERWPVRQQKLVLDARLRQLAPELQQERAWTRVDKARPPKLRPPEVLQEPFSEPRELDPTQERSRLLSLRPARVP